MKKLLVILMMALALGACCKAKTKCADGKLYVYKADINVWEDTGRNCLAAEEPSDNGAQRQ